LHRQEVKVVNSNSDFHVEDLKAMLRKKFISLRIFERQYNIPSRSASAALYRPHAAAEKAISRALQIPASKIWPSRYHSNGRRLSVQPSENYRAARGKAA
jgi:Ner family transcriptional regulator